MRVSSSLTTAFLAGWLVQFALLQMHQDIMGKERYLKYTELAWADTHWAMWLGIATIVFCFYQWDKHRIVSRLRARGMDVEL